MFLKIDIGGPRTQKTYREAFNNEPGRRWRKLLIVAFPLVLKTLAAREANTHSAFVYY